MINAELTENPVLEELDNSVPLLDEVSAREEKLERDSSIAQLEQPATTPEEKDPFEEIDFGSFFSEYLDPGLRTSIEMEDSEKPSFENFLSKPSTLSDHLMWQLGSLHVNEDVYRAAELVIGNMNEEGYLTASDDELLGLAVEEAQEALGIATEPLPSEPSDPAPTSSPVSATDSAESFQPESNGFSVAVAEEEVAEISAMAEADGMIDGTLAEGMAEGAISGAEPESETSTPQRPRPTLVPPRTAPARVPFSRDALKEAIDVIKQMDPIGVGARDLRECLLAQLHDLKRVNRRNANGNHVAELEALDDAIVLVDQHLHALQNKKAAGVAPPPGMFAIVPWWTCIAAMPV